MVDYARGKGISIPNNPEYLLDDSILKQIDPVFYYNLKYRQIKHGPNSSSAPKVVGKISLDALNTSNPPIENANLRPNALKKKKTIEKNIAVVQFF